ncbi:MAG: hypothetical protein KDA81_15250 [Planctomycetaceae bacterium]|nr:hypothetical protein [Planctomycetaceae bacterium]
MTEFHESQLARRWLLQSLWLRQSTSVLKSEIMMALAVIRESLESGHSVLPGGIVIDVVRLAFSGGTGDSADEAIHPAWKLSAGMQRTYEDYVLGKLIADATFERGTGAVCGYQGRERAQGLAWLLNRFMERSDCSGVMFSPSIVRTVQESSLDDILAEGMQLLQTEDVLPVLDQQYSSLIQQTRQTGDVLSAEDVFELEYRTALVDFGQRLALRQVLRTSRMFRDGLNAQPPVGLERRHDVPAAIKAEDSYPVGGFTSISTRGTVESLLHSQLALMETDESRRPDLFEIRYLRNELLYYSRDENHFLRSRRTYLFVMQEDLAASRIKDADLPVQRIMQLLGLLTALVQQLLKWLTDETICFQFVFVKDRPVSNLVHERELLELIFREQIANGAVEVRFVSEAMLAETCVRFSRISLTHRINVSTNSPAADIEGCLNTDLRLARDRPTVTIDRQQHEFHGDVKQCWTDALNLLFSGLI